MTRFNTRLKNIIEFTPANGPKIYLSPLTDSYILTEEGTGMPPIEYITERGPFQHGVTPKDYFLQPRILQYRLRQQGCSAAEKANIAATLLNNLRPNYDPDNPSGLLTKYLPNNTVRSIYVSILEGPGFKARSVPGKWDEWAIDEIIRFIAFDPVYFDPTVHTETFGPCGSAVGFPYTFPFPFGTEECQLIFPITFPITFEAFDIPDILNNAGTWESFPVITITGQALGVRIYNDTTGEILELLGYTIPVGDTVTIDLQNKTITDNNGTDLMAYLSQESDFTTWHLEPGDNDIRVTIGSHSTATQVTFTWYDRFIGIPGI